LFSFSDGQLIQPADVEKEIHHVKRRHHDHDDLDQFLNPSSQYGNTFTAHSICQRSTERRQQPGLNALVILRFCFGRGIFQRHSRNGFHQFHRIQFETSVVQKDNELARFQAFAFELKLQVFFVVILGPFNDLRRQSSAESFI